MSIEIWIIIAVIAAIFILTNYQLIGSVFNRSGLNPKYRREKIETRYFSVVKPDGFYIPEDNSSGADSLYLEELNLYSENGKGALTIVGGEQIQEEFKQAWARITVTNKFRYESLVGAIRSEPRVVLEESETVSPDGAHRTLLATTVEKSPHQMFEIEARFKAIEDRQTNQVYELAVCVLTSEKEKFAKAVDEIIESFTILSESANAWFAAKIKIWTFGGGKHIVFGIYQRNDFVFTEVVPDVQKKTLQAIIRRRVSLNSAIHSDGWRDYNGLVDVGFNRHYRVNHSNNELVRGLLALSTG